MQLGAVSRRLLLLGLSSLVACATLEVRTDYDAAVDFQRYQSFAWLEPPLRETVGGADPADEDAVQNSLLDKRVRTAVDRWLRARGLERAEPEEAQLLVRYRARIDEFLQESGSSVGWGAGSVHGGRSVYTRSTFHDSWWTTRRVREGVLTIDLIDAGTKQIVWRGWTVGRNPEGYFSADDVSLSVTKLMALFPPRPPGAD